MAVGRDFCQFTTLIWGRKIYWIHLRKKAAKEFLPWPPLNQWLLILGLCQAEFAVHRNKAHHRQAEQGGRGATVRYRDVIHLKRV